MVTRTIKMRKRKPSRVNKDNAPRPSDVLLKRYCKDIDEWSDNWAGGDADVPIGNAIIEEFKPFLLDRIERGRAKSTVKKYADYLCCLGGEIIRNINQDEVERKLSARQLILKHIDNSGGPYWRHARDELDHDRYDSVCRCLYKFMTASP